MKCVLICISILLIANLAKAQNKLFTKSGKIAFYSKAKLEDIEAVNKTVVAILDIQTGEIQFSVPMKGFEFRKALMQEHFNENYIESDKYPKSDFKGSIINNSEIDFKKNGTYTAKARGKLTIHGVTNDIEAEGKIIVSDAKLTLSTVFTVSVQEYKIKNDKINNISDNIKITVDCLLGPLP